MSSRPVMLAGIGVLCAAPFFLPPFYLTLLNQIGLYSIAAIGLVLLTGVVGLTSFGQAAFVGVGAYTTGYLSTRFGVSPWVTLPLALALTVFAAFLIGLLTVRLSGHYLILGTIAWSISLYYVCANTEALGGYNGVTNIPSLSLAGYDLGTEKGMFFLIWFVLGIAMVLLFNLLDSRAGRAVRALRSVELAESVGIPTVRLKLIAFIYCAAFAAIGGWLYAHYMRYVNPIAFNINASFDYVFMIVVGGAAHVWGAVAGSSAITVLKTALQDIMPAFSGSSSQFELIAFGVLMIVILQRAPDGIMPWLLRFLPRRQIAVPSDAIALPRRIMPAFGEPILEVDKIRKAFGGLTAVRDVSFGMMAGEILGLIGPNGAGKSTMFGLISGLLPPNHGEVRLCGERITGLPPHSIIRRGLARTFQHVQLRPNMSVLENVALGAYTRGRSGTIAGALHIERVENARLLSEARRQLERVGLGEHLQDEADSLPLGKQRLIEIARALCADPILLLLDEPAAGLRFLEKAALTKLLVSLRAEGVSILLVEHDMEFVMGLVNRLVVMDFGEKISEGEPAQVQIDRKVVEAYLGVHA